ncbi:FecR domain-containing protein [Qipengyuania sp. 6B39]|uniref:FecR domain-containing protein n=1 Tax=Qipengyuania proteolytica TaxID=2867239 RepID=UPI001C899674|nr:FecR domain-containing protein [Qipengyuania proteolytica]MBX7495092.1 FecR domain-containing protein [Qipengyuania proteolytica]
MKLAMGLLLALAGLVGLQTPAAAQSGETVEYVVRRGDTLNDLAREYFTGQRAVPAVMRLNRIRDPRRMPTGKVLTLPRSILRYQPEPLRVLAFSGPVSITRSGAEQALAVGNPVLEGARVTTGRDGFISIGGRGNSRVSLPSNSAVEIRQARRYVINDAVDFDVRVLRGRTETVAPKLKANERFRVGTPMAVTAVRGTEFRVAFYEGEDRSLTEVVEGAVVVATGAAEQVAEAGLGVASVGERLGDPEALLPAPDVVDAGRIQTGEVLEFVIEEVAKAEGYRTQIARDAGFIELIAEEVSEAPVATFEDIGDGRLFVRSRAIAESKLEGFADTHSFRRKRVGAAASVESLPYDDAFKFVWLPEGEGKSYAGFQLWNATRPDAMIVDEIGLQTKGFYIGSLAPGSYKWRVATFQIDDGDIIKVWGPTQDFTVSD